MTHLDTMIDAALAAAKVICEVYDSPFAAEYKKDGSPVTVADQRAEDAILARLGPLGLPVIAEESVTAGRIPETGERWFCVDPLDGTREFLKRNGEFTVNIALIEQGRPVAGVVLAPTTGALYYGSGAGAYEATVGGNDAIGPRMPIAVIPDAPLRLVASRSHGHGAVAALMRAMAVEADVSVGSSLKFCLLARGDAQLYPRFTPTSEWDTAAGQAVLEAAGGVVLTLDGKPMRYGNAAGSYLNPFFIAAASADLAKRAAAEMLTLI
jgi:3'(2'), 5'-bisphosphate nucleotidase